MVTYRKRDAILGQSMIYRLLYPLIGLFVLCLVPSAWGQDELQKSSIKFAQAFPKPEASVRTLTIQESIEAALANNLTVKAALEKVKTAEQKVKEALAAFMPAISASGSYTYFGELPTTDFEFDPSMIGLTPEIIEALKQMSGTGGVGADTTATGKKPKEFSMAKEDNYKAGLTVQQPIFTWGKIYNNYKQAKFGLEASQQELEAVKQQVILDVTRAFYGVLLTEKLVKVAEMAVEQVQAHVKIAQELVDAGMATNFDLLRAKVQLANIRSQFIRAQNGLKLSKDGFKSAIGMDLNTQISVQGELVYRPLELNLDQLIETAMTNRPEIKQLRCQEQVGKRFVSIAKAGNKPNIALIGNYSLDSYAEKLGDAFKKDEWNDSWNVTLALQVPIFDGLATRARAKQAESGLRQIQLGMEQLKDGIGLEVRAAFLSFQESKELLKAQEDAVQQAEESLRIAKLQYKNGMITSVELMDAELAFTQAQTNHFNALHDYIVAIAKLEKATASKIG